MTLRFGPEQLERHSCHVRTWEGHEKDGLVERSSTHSVRTQEMPISSPSADSKQEVVVQVGSSKERSVLEIWGSWGLPAYQEIFKTTQLYDR